MRSREFTIYLIASLSGPVPHKPTRDPPLVFSRENISHGEETTMPLIWIGKQLNMGAAGSLANLLRDAGEK